MERRLAKGKQGRRKQGEFEANLASLLRVAHSDEVLRAPADGDAFYPRLLAEMRANSATDPAGRADFPDWVLGSLVLEIGILAGLAVLILGKVSLPWVGGTGNVEMTMWRLPLVLAEIMLACNAVGIGLGGAAIFWTRRSREEV